ncbi:hypothetical protein BV379_10345 [Rhodovulum sulfidophilum]|nr:hypothetical protein BV379_10345 [Rhodovulum sulfidophilum]
MRDLCEPGKDFSASLLAADYLIGISALVVKSLIACIDIHEVRKRILFRRQVVVIQMRIFQRIYQGARLIPVDGHIRYLLLERPAIMRVQPLCWINILVLFVDTFRQDSLKIFMIFALRLVAFFIVPAFFLHLQCSFGFPR